jgi:hypothetical protein
MKYLGGILMFIAIVAVAKVADWKPEPDRMWILEIVRIVNAVLFLGGLLVFGNGIKGEVVNELRCRSGNAGGPAEPGATPARGDN